MSIHNAVASLYAPPATSGVPVTRLAIFAVWTALLWSVTDRLPGQEKTTAPADSAKAPAPLAFDYLRLAHPTVAEHLQLTDTQRSQITQLLTARATQLSQAPAGERPAIITAANQKLAALLTEPQRQRLSTLPAERALYFQFVEQTWPEVLTWFAEQSDLSLVMNAPPAGTFTYRDMKGYSPRDAIDLLNSVLLTKGFSLVRRDRTLILMELNSELTAELIPTVSFDKIDQRGRFEFVTILFPLGKRSPIAVDTAVQQLLKPYGRALTLAQTKQIRITDMAAKMPAYSLLISAVPEPKTPAAPAKPAPPPKPVLQTYPYQGFDAQVGVQTLKNLIPGVTYYADQKAKQISVFGTPNQQAAVKATLDQLTKIPPRETASLLEVYILQTAPSETLPTQLKLVAPDAQVSIDPAQLRMVVYGSPSEQAAIRATLEKLGIQQQSPGNQQLKAYDLKGNDPAAIRSALEALVPGISLHPTSDGLRLLARATAKQHTAISAALSELSPAKRPDQLRTLRFYRRSQPLPNGLLSALESLVSEANLAWDATSLRLSAVATAAQHALIQETLRQFDADGNQPAPPTLRIYPVNEIQSGRFSRLQSSLLDAYPGMRVIDSETAGELAILATPTQHTQFAKLLETLVTDAAKTPRELQSHPLPGKVTDAIRGLLTERVPDAQLTWDDATDRLIVLGTEQEQEQVKQLLTQIAEQLPPAAPPTLKIYPVEQIQRQRFLQLQSALTTQFPEMQVVESTNLRELVIWAMPRQHQQLLALLETLSDRQLPANRTVVVAYPVTVGVPSEARELLAEMYPALKIVADDAHQRLLVWATEKEHGPLQAFMEQWNRSETPSQTRKLVPYQFPPGEAEPLLPALTELVPQMQLSVVGNRIVAWGGQRDHDRLAAFAKPLLVDSKPPERHVQVYPTEGRDPDQILQIFLTLAPTANYALDPRTGGMAMLATAEEHERMRATLEQISQLDQQPGKDRSLELYRVEPAPVSETSQLLRDALPDLEFISTAPGRLLIQGTADEHQRARALIEKIRASVSPEDPREVRVHPVRRMPAAAMLGLLPPDLLESVSIRTQEPNLIINGSPRLQRALTAAIKQIEDQLPPPPVGVTPVIQVHTVRRMSAADLLELLPPGITANISFRRQGQNLIVSGNAGQHAALAAAIKGIEEQFPDATDGVTPEVRVYRLQFASARSADRLVEELLPDVSSILDSASQTIVVTTSPAEHERVASMLKQLDQPQQTDKSTRIYSFQHCNPAPAQTVLASLVPNANISVDTNVMKLVATATNEEHQQIAAVCEQLDQQSEEQQPVSRVYRLPPQSAPALQTAINGLLPRATVTLEATSGTVVVTAPAAEHTQILELVEQLAQRGEEQQVVSRVYRLPPQTAPALQTAINGLLPQATVTLDSTSGTVVVTAPAAEHSQVLELVEQLAQPDVDQQLVSQVYRLPPQTAPALQTAIKGLLPRATVALDETSGTVVVTARPLEHQQILDLVDQLKRKDPSAARMATTYQTGSMSAEVVADAVRAAFPQNDISCHPSQTDRSLVVVAPPAYQLAIRAMVAQISGGENTIPSTLRVFQLDQANGESVRTVLETLFRDQQPRAEIRLNPQGNQLLAVATELQHVQIEGTLKQLQGSRRLLEVFPLRVVDPFTAQSSIEQLFRGASQNTAPITDVDSVTQKLFVRGTPEQITEIREMLGKMGEPSLSPGKQRGPLRMIPLDGSPLEAIQRIQRVWSQLRENEIRILSPEGQPPPANPTPPNLPQPPATDSEKPVEPATTTARVHRLTAAPPAPPASKPPILIIPGDSGITIASSDQEALDRFETLLHALLRNDDARTGPASNFSIIALENADSSQIQKLLRELWDDMPVTLRGGPGELVVVAAERLNSLVVYGSRTDRSIAEYLANSLDTPDPASSIGLRRPRIISVEHTDAEDIQSALRSVYKSQLTTGGGRKRVSIPEGVSADVASVLQQINAAATAPLLTLHVDQKTNSIIVNAPLQLADEIAEFVKTMDTQAQAHPARTVQLIPLKGGNAKRVRRALKALRD